MARVKRMERVVALTKQLVDHPYQLFSFTYFPSRLPLHSVSPPAYHRRKVSLRLS